MARKRRDQAEWLLVAWAAEGPDRDVAVEVPDLGRLTLLARACGSVYRARAVRGEPELVLVDADGLYPTKAL